MNTFRLRTVFATLTTTLILTAASAAAAQEPPPDRGSTGGQGQGQGQQGQGQGQGQGGRETGSPPGTGNGSGAQDPKGGEAKSSDREAASSSSQIILDAKELKREYSEALRPLREQLEKTTLDERYQEITRILESEEVDGPSLVGALRGLKGELDSFVADLPSVREKLFVGSDNLGDRIRDFRMVLARTRDAQAAAKKSDPESGSTDALTALDDELSSIAKEVKKAENPRRKALLKERFKFLYLARKRIAEIGPRLGGLDEAVMGNVLNFLVSIRAKLDQAATGTIVMQMGLQQQQSLVGKFLVLIENLQETDKLAEEIKSLSNIDAPDFGDLADKMNEVTESLLGYTDTLERKTGKATELLAEKLQATPAKSIDDLELDRLIDEASNRGAAEVPEEKGKVRIDR